MAFVFYRDRNGKLSQWKVCTYPIWYRLNARDDRHCGLPHGTLRITGWFLVVTLRSHVSSRDQIFPHSLNQMNHMMSTCIILMEIYSTRIFWRKIKCPIHGQRKSSIDPDHRLHNTSVISVVLLLDFQSGAQSRPSKWELWIGKPQCWQDQQKHPCVCAFLHRLRMPHHVFGA